MSNRVVAVTGGGGFIGSHICDALANDPSIERVLAIDDESCGTFSNIESAKVIKEKVDCSKQSNMKFFFNLHKVDTIVHCAANAREGASQFQPGIVTRRNLDAYANTLSAAIQTGVSRVCLFSSMSVYGDQKPPFSEGLPLKPVDVYAVNKAGMEQITEILSNVHGFSYVILRPHNVFGSRQMFDLKRNVIAIFMNRIMRKEPLFIYGDGEQMRSFSYIEDSLPSFIYAINNIEALNKTTINVGGVEHISINHLAEVVLDAMGAGGVYPIDHLPDRPCEVKNAYTTYTLSQHLLNYCETVGWKSGVYKMAEWAMRLGPQEWRDGDPIEIASGAIPKVWL